MKTDNSSTARPSGGEGVSTSRSSCFEVGGAFLKLGLISFGGPVAHLGYFRNEFVERRGWLNDASYADLVALCQFLPGPASSQVVFALGFRRAGLIGAIVASMCFTLPSAALMIAFAYGVLLMRITQAGDLGSEGGGWLHGLKLAAVPVVAHAVWGMGKSLCPDRPRLLMCLGMGSALLFYPGAWIQVGAIAAGAALGLWLYRRDGGTPAFEIPARATGKVRVVAFAALVMFAALLIGSPVLTRVTSSPAVSVFEKLYRAGSLVFGGGHVVLPLLRAELVPGGFIDDDAFLAGYGAAQALPGPLFTFASFLGATMPAAPRPRWLGGLFCLFAIFLPAWLLVGGALPFWDSLRSKAWTRAALRGANAAVVGVLLAALYNPVIRESVRQPRDAAIALLGFAALACVRAPAWLVVLASAAAGAWLG